MKEVVFGFLILAVVYSIFTVGISNAQTPPLATYAAKAGETIDLGPIYWVNSQTCQSLATAKSDVEILEGPPGLTIEVKEDMVIPTSINCKNKVKGGRVTLTVPADI